MKRLDALEGPVLAARLRDAVNADIYTEAPECMSYVDEHTDVMLAAVKRLTDLDKMVRDLADVIEAHQVHGDVDFTQWVIDARMLTKEHPGS
jgi:hypothetical protein